MLVFVCTVSSRDIDRIIHSTRPIEFLRNSIFNFMKWMTIKVNVILVENSFCIYLVFFASACTFFVLSRFYVNIKKVFFLRFLSLPPTNGWFQRSRQCFHYENEFSMQRALASNTQLQYLHCFSANWQLFRFKQFFFQLFSFRLLYSWLFCVNSVFFYFINLWQNYLQVKFWNLNFQIKTNYDCKRVGNVFVIGFFFLFSMRVEKITVNISSIRPNT